jgi:hypothetical protein
MRLMSVAMWCVVAGCGAGGAGGGDGSEAPGGTPGDAGGDTGTPGPPALEGPGRLRLFAMADGVSATAPEQLQFDLGETAGSQTFDFVLVNHGSRPITDITLATGHPAFEVTPAHLDRLDPPGPLTIPQGLRISVTHGPPLVGGGYGELLPPGRNTSTLSVTAMTDDGAGNAVPLTYLAELSVMAHVIRFTIHTNDGELDLTQPWGEMLTGLMEDYAPKFQVSPGPATITNTGTVPFDLEIESDRSWGPSQRLELGADAPLDLDLEDRALRYIRVSSSNYLYETHEYIQPDNSIIMVFGGEIP